jgi:hypothetical protein
MFVSFEMDFTKQLSSRADGEDNLAFSAPLSGGEWFKEISSPYLSDVKAVRNS